MKYLKNSDSVEVDAMQLNCSREGIVAMREFLGVKGINLYRAEACYDLKPGSLLDDCTYFGERNNYIVRTGDWFVKYDGNIIILSDEQFHLEYEAIES